MAIKVTVEKTHLWVRVILFLVALGLIWLNIRTIRLTYFGTTTTGTITHVSVSQSEDEDGFTTEVTQSYTYTVDGVEYTGSATFTLHDDDGYAKKGRALVPFDTEFINQKKSQTQIQVRYMPDRPEESNAAALTKKNAGNVAQMLLYFAVAALLLFIALKGGGKKEKRPSKKVRAEANAAMARYQAAPPVVYPPGYTQPGNTQPARFCPNCGAPVDGAFCGQCGGRIG